MIALYLAAGVCLGLNNGLANTLINWLYTGRNGTATREQVASLHPQAFKTWSALIPAKPLPSPPTCALRVCPCASAVGPWVNLINASFGLGASSAPLLFVAIEHSVGNGLVAFSVIGALAAVPGLAASLLASPNAPPQKMDDVALAPVKAGAAGGLSACNPRSEERATPSRGLGSSHGGSTIAGIDLGSRAAYVRLTVIYPIMGVMTLVIGSEIAYAGWVYSYAMSRVGMRSAEAAYLNSLFWTAFTAGRVCTIPLAACLSPAGLILPTSKAPRETF